ncbi:hypothetical protein [Shewanella sp.]|uniref:hypothetical protein n=1 Tax=Shewanella sp. TaxID=50422 RepID=UPI001EC5BC03|nr:hypothetical protein [Shewanella sp.]NRB25097.1 hypothetical protein [Shewanella sp.]
MNICKVNIGSGSQRIEHGQYQLPKPSLQTGAVTFIGGGGDDQIPAAQRCSLTVTSLVLHPC